MVWFKRIRANMRVWREREGDVADDFGYVCLDKGKESQ